MTTVAHVLIVAPNWLGDAVMALPAMADVVRASSGASISVAARPSIAPLFTMVPGLERALTLEAGRQRARAVGQLREGAYGAVLLLPNSFQAALTAWRAGIPDRWGYRTDCRGPLLTRAIVPPDDRLHQAASYQYLTGTLGYPNGPLEPRLDPTAEGHRAARELLISGGWDEREPLVALAPGAAYGGAKRWPADSFAKLSAALARDGVRSVLIGGAGDAAAGADVLRALACEPEPINLIGRTDLPSLAGVLVRCRALVSNDSGAMHVGAALGVPVTAMFGPTDERATRPLGRAGAREPVVITQAVWCRPCLLRECPLTHRCMRDISVERVARAVGVSLQS